MGDAAGTLSPSHTMPCAQCGDVLIAPIWSEHVNERRVRHVWACEACGYEFESTVHLGWRGIAGSEWMRPTEIPATMRRTAEKCVSLSREMAMPEQKFLLLGLASGWIALAEMAERLWSGG
jgi:predicted RNA-binding Zn-ribbon protein involved in translation (DUF1610 family)